MKSKFEFIMITKKEGSRCMTIFWYITQHTATHPKFFISKSYPKWCVINWVVDNSLQDPSELIVLSHQPIDK